MDELTHSPIAGDLSESTFTRQTGGDSFPLHVWEDDVKDEIVAHGLINFRKRRLHELATFFVLAFGIWPVVAVGVVAGYGFIVWFYQILNGPPGPNGG